MAVAIDKMTAAEMSVVQMTAAEMFVVEMIGNKMTADKIYS